MSKKVFLTVCLFTTLAACAQGVDV